MKNVLFLIVFIFLFNSSYSWRSFQRFYAGAEEIGIGCAGVSDTGAESGIIYNLASITTLYSTNRNFIFSYEVFTTFKLIDILALKVDFDFDIFPFICFIYPEKDWGLSLSIENLFHSPETTTELYIRFIKVGFSYKILENLSIGIGCGPVLANENNGNAISFAYQAGILFKPLEKLHLGLSFLSPVEINWHTTPYGEKLKETYPMELNIGASYHILKEAILYFSMENSFLNQIKFIVDEKDTSPEWTKNGFLYLKPAIGLRFLERLTGGHLSIGVFMDYNATEYSVNPQYNITFGFRGYGKNFKYNLSFTDGFIIGLFYDKNIPNENININLSFYL